MFREHFIGARSKFKDPKNLAEFLDEYENTQTVIKIGFTNDEYSPKRFNRDVREFMSNPHQEYSKN